MDTITIASILEQVDRLSPDDQLLLIAHVATKVRHNTQSGLQKYRWRDLRGLLPAMALGEDAQDWVSRTRSESDQEREKQWTQTL